MVNFVVVGKASCGYEILKKEKILLSFPLCWNKFIISEKQGLNNQCTILFLVYATQASLIHSDRRNIAVCFVWS